MGADSRRPPSIPHAAADMMHRRMHARPPHATLPPNPAAEIAIMHRLREAVAQSGLNWAEHAGGWDPHSLAHPCSWEGVICPGHHIVEL